MKIGKIGSFGKERVNFRDYIKKYWKPGTEKELYIKRIFLPQVYNSFTLILEDKENNLEIKRTLQPELGKNLIREFKLSIKKDTPGMLILKIDAEGNQEIIKINTLELGYRFEKNSYVLTELKTEDEDLDLPF
jgi:hypothetical protein